MVHIHTLSIVGYYEDHCILAPCSVVYPSLAGVTGALFAHDHFLFVAGSMQSNRTGHLQNGSLAGVARPLKRNTGVPRAAP